eukprot:jgi/Bigna1/51616/estExt_Genewise1Plus.C_20035
MGSSSSTSSSAKASSTAAAPESKEKAISPSYGKKVKTVYLPAVEKELPDLAGKVFAITGTTSGTGYAMAKLLGSKGAQLILLNRKSSRSEAAEKKLQEEVKDCKANFVECDLQSFSSVREAAEAVLKLTGENGLDGLGLNAGIMACPDNATGDGCDVQMQTNHLSHFLLTSLLFPALSIAAEKRGDARIVSMTSLARKGKPLETKFYGKNGGNLGGDDNPTSMQKGPRWERYHQSKLANCVFTYALHDRLEASSKLKGKIKAVVAHPGLSSTNLQVRSQKQGKDSMPGWFGWVFGWMAMSPVDGSLGFVKGLAGKDTKSGEFIGPNRMGELYGPPVLLTPEPYLKEENAKKALWEESEKTTGCKFEIA